MAQASGRVACVFGDRVESAAWPFADLGFSILRTGQKTATHEHLAMLDRSTLGGLGLPAHAVARALSSRAKLEFLAALKTFAGELQRRLRLQAPLTLDILQEP